MSSEAVLEAAPMVGNAHLGQRGSGHSVVPRAQHASRLRAGIRAGLRSGRGCRQTMRTRGVCAPALEHQFVWEGLVLGNGRQSRGQNRTREIRPSGIVGGLWETWSMVELGTRRTIERVRVGNSPPTDARAQFLSRQPHAAFDEAGAGNGSTVWLMRHSRRKRGATDMLDLARHRASSRPYIGGYAVCST
jgi:hypothetical protein